MWIVTTDGFYSINCYEGMMNVRSRSKTDLENFALAVGGRCSEVIELPKSDYPYRVMCGRNVLQEYLVESVQQVTYRNFKDEVAKTNPERAHTYIRVWSALLDIETEGLKYFQRNRLFAYDDFDEYDDDGFPKERKPRWKIW